MSALDATWSAWKGVAIAGGVVAGGLIVAVIVLLCIARYGRKR